MFGPRKLLRTLSTVSIHESVEGLAGGLAAMGPIGKAIIERRETAADAPPSELPRDFLTVREEEDGDGEWGRSAGGSRGGSERDTGSVRDSEKVKKKEFDAEKDKDKEREVEKEKGVSGEGEGSNVGVKSVEQAGTPGSARSGESKENRSAGDSTPSKKKEKRFIIF